MARRGACSDEGDTVTATESYRELPVFFPAGRETLFGVLTEPRSAPTGVTVVLVPGGAGTLDGINRNRLWVRLARDLAARGCHAFRFDYHGAGESTGEGEQLRLDRPFVSDLTGATDWLSGQGLRKQILVGSCFGARTALAAAKGLPEIRGMILATPFVRDLAQGERVATLRAVGWTPRQYLRHVLRLRTIRGFLQTNRRRAYVRVARTKLDSLRGRGAFAGRSDRKGLVSHNFLDPFEDVLARAIPMLVLFGEDDDAFHEFQQERQGVLGRLIDAAGPSIDLETVPGKIHGLRSLVSQQSFLDHSMLWLQRKGHIQAMADV
jgi:pimeloyl-ACP methyl ester carboxylesterase